MLGGPWGPRLTEENSEEREPLGVKCVRVCGCVCMCEREGGQCYFNPELTSGCSTTPPAAPVCWLLYQSTCRAVVILSFSLPQLSSSLLSPSAVFFSIILSLFFSRSTQIHRCSVTSPPEGWRAVWHFRMYCTLAVLFAHQVSWWSDPVTDHLVTLTTHSYTLERQSFLEF